MKAFQVWMVAREPATLQELGRVMLRESDSRENCEVFNEALIVADKINLARSHFGRAVHVRQPLYVVLTLPSFTERVRDFKERAAADVKNTLSRHLERDLLESLKTLPQGSEPDPIDDLAQLATPWKPGTPLGGVDAITVSGKTYQQVFCECKGTASSTEHPTRCGVCGRAFK